MLVVLVVICSALGGLASRSIVAQADAHRRTGGDDWWGPSCEACGAPLGVTMARCTRNGHRQRMTNVGVLATSCVVFGMMPIVVSSLWLLPAYLSFGYFVVLLTVTDLDTKLLPNRILLPATVVGVALLAVGAIADGSPIDVVRALAAGAAYFGVMLALALIARGALGMGDVKLAFYLGIFTGFLGWWYVAIAALGGFLLGGLVSILLLASRRVSRKDSIPFGPFMAGGAVLAVAFGDAIVAWYVG